MIQHQPPSDNLDGLVGRIIFHLSRGVPAALAVTGSPRIGVRLVGEVLGKVVRLNGPNRVFYIDRSGAEKYVSIAGIGFVCDTDAEAQALEELRQRTAADIAQAVTQIQQRVEVDVAALMQRRNS
jgi:hypothetical protein